MQALAQARRPAAVRTPERATAPVVMPVHLGTSGAAALMQSGPTGSDESSLWSRLGWLLPTLALVLGLVGIDQWRDRESIAAMAELDAELLGDDLPPAAYADAGFSEFLKRPFDVTPQENTEPPPSPTEAPALSVLVSTQP
jgi:hypothetical protein